MSLIIGNYVTPPATPPKYLGVAPRRINRTKQLWDGVNLKSINLYKEVFSKLPEKKVVLADIDDDWLHTSLDMLLAAELGEDDSRIFVRRRPKRKYESLDPIAE